MGAIKEKIRRFEWITFTYVYMDLNKMGDNLFPNKYYYCRKEPTWNLYSEMED